MSYAHHHFDLELTAYQPVNTVGVVSLYPKDNGKFRDLVGGKSVHSAPCHNVCRIKLGSTGFRSATVATGLGIGSRHAVHVKTEAYCLVKSLGDV